MIRRTLAGLTCILLALGLGVFGEVYLRHTAAKLIAATELSAEISPDDLFQTALTAVGAWEKCAPLMSALIKHSDADELGKLFTELGALAANKNEERTRQVLLACSAALRTLSDGERLKWENVLNVIFINI